jgi:hypothetical protein
MRKLYCQPVLKLRAVLLACVLLVQLEAREKPDFSKVLGTIPQVEPVAKKIDVNQDGLLSRAEYIKHLKSIPSKYHGTGFMGHEDAAQVATQLYGDADTNGDDVIDMQELKGYASKENALHKEEEHMWFYLRWFHLVEHSEF